MKFLTKSKDGGPESTVDAYWLLEVKGLISVALLRFGAGSRKAFHSHAFYSLNWQLSGQTVEQKFDPVTGEVRGKRRSGGSLRPIAVMRRHLHRVISEGVSWVLTIRGPWQKHWLEYDPGKDEFSVLEHGRGVVARGLDAAEAAWLLWLMPKDMDNYVEGRP